MSDVKDYIKTNKNDHIAELVDFLKIPSISTDSKYKDDILSCANWLMNHLKNIGFEDVKLIKSKGCPLLYASWLKAEGKPTVLIYGHYDVQPPDPLDEWQTPPFEPEIRDDKIYARGASDNKGQIFAHIKALEYFLKNSGKLPVNVRILIEGEEECNGHVIHDYVKENLQALKSDIILVSDTQMIGKEHPSLSYGLRGICTFELEITGTKKDLHSGQHGGAVVNPNHALANIISQLKDDKGKILIPGFYDDVKGITVEEKSEFEKHPFDERQYCEAIGAPELFGEHPHSILECLQARPTLDVNGIIGGYTGEGFKTVIPAKALAKISIRLVPSQEPEDIRKKFEEYVRSIAPKTVKAEVRFLAGMGPWSIELQNDALKTAGRAIKKSFGKEPLFEKCGGSIPVVKTLSEELRAPAVLIGFGLPDDDIHAPNEKFDLEQFSKGIETIIYFLEILADVK